MYQTLEKATIKISEARFLNLVVAAEKGKAVEKVLRVQKEIPVESGSAEAVYLDKATGTRIFGVVEESVDFDGKFYITFKMNAKSGKMEAFVQFSRLCFSNFCGNGVVKAVFVRLGKEEEVVLGSLETECGEHFFHGFKTLFVDGTDNVSFGAALNVFGAAKPGDAKNATNRGSGLTMMEEWDAGVSTEVMKGIVGSQMAHEVYFKRLFKVAELCKALGGVEAADVHMIEATDDATWGWGGPRKVAKLAAEGVTEAWVAATMPLMMGEDVVEFKAEGGVVFKKAQNKLGKILTTAMRAAAWFEGNHAAFMASAVGMEMTTFKVGVVASAAEPERASEEAAEAADGGGGGAAKRGAEGAAGGGPAAKRSLSYGQ
jgi:hypothetical protein